MNLFQTAWKNIMFRKTLSFLSIFSVATATALVIFITLSQEGIRVGAAKGYGPYELVIGAEGSGTQLALSTFYHIGAPVGNIPYETYEELIKSGLADKAFPMTKGDNYQGFQIIGTDSGYLSTRYPNVSLTAGNLYDHAGEVVIGSYVADTLRLEVGDTFYGGHGAVWTDTEEHENLTYRVVGILPQLHTPDDKAIFTTLDTAWLVHSKEGHGEKLEHAEEEDGEHAGEGDITTIVVKPKGLTEMQQIKNKMNELDKVQAVFSSKAVADVLNMMDTGGKFVKIIAGTSVLIAAISVLLSLSASAAERKKDIGLLRLLGKSKFVIMSGLVLEGSILTFIGTFFGFVLGHTGSAMLSGIIFDYAGIQINPWTFAVMKIYVAIGAIAIGIGMLASIWPALGAYKVQPLELFRS